MDNKEFKEWFENVKYSETFLTIYVGHLRHKRKENPDYSITLKEWGKIYYTQCVDI